MTGGREYQKRWMELWRLTDNVYTMYLRRWELSLNEYLVLESLREFPKGMQPAQLAERVSIQRQLVTIILNKLEERGFILRRESRTDHRRKIIRLNPAGRVFAEEVCVLWSSWICTVWKSSRIPNGKNCWSIPSVFIWRFWNVPENRIESYQISG